MLTRLQLDDWKSFGEKSVVDLARLTFLVGPNASGKSNFFDALRFLQGIALDLPIAEVLRGRWEGGREIWPGIRGGSQEAVRLGRSRFALESWWQEQRILAHRIEIELEPEPAVHAEWLHDPTGWYYFDTHAETLGSGKGRIAGGGINVAMWSSGSGRSATATCSSTRSLLGQIRPEGRVRPDVLEAIQEVRDPMRGLVFLDIQPSRMRGYASETTAPLASSGENLSAVLARLSGDARQKQDLVDWISELCVPEIEDIDFVRTELKDVMLVLVERGGRRVSAKSLSDGTLRFLGELAALMTCPERSILVMEEPEMGLHPPRIHLLAQLLQTITKQRKLQVIAATHSPTLLEHLDDDTLAAVVAFGRAPETSTTTMSRLADLPNFDTFRRRENLGNLFATGWVEQSL